MGAVQTPVVNNMLIGTTTYTFVPGAGQCAQQYSINVTVNALPIVTIDGLASAYCKDAQSVTLAGTPAGGAFTIDGNSATTFEPALLSSGPHTVVYSVTDANTCSNSVSTTVTVNALPVVSFPGTFSDQCNTLTTFALTGGDPAGGVYSGAGVIGSNFDASTAILGANTITYTFTDANSCSNSATNSITVVNCTTVAGSVVSTGNTPATVAGTNIPDATAFVSLLDNASAILQTKEVIGGVYSFDPVVDGTYKVVLHNLAGGSATPIFPNGYAAFRIEGAIGSAGDNNPNGIIEITLPTGTITSGAKVAAGTVNASFGVQAGPLPVRLISFTGKSTAKGNELSWKTSQEQNFSHYEIERSNDSKSFKNIGKVLGAGNSKENLNYSFIDNSASLGVVPGASTNRSSFEGNTYYRLKMIDLDGSHEYSKIIFIKNDVSAIEVGNFYPNPAFGNEVSIKIKSPERNSMTITSYDLSGKMINVETKMLEKGENNLKLSISRIQSKNTIFRFELGSNVIYRKLNN